MSTEQTEAIVIRLANFSESSLVVTLFSRDWGKLAALAKGAKRPKGAFEGALDLLSVCRIVFIRKSSSGLDILTEAQLCKRFKPTDRQLNNLYGGYYVAELLSGLTEPYDPHPLLYQEASRALDGLSGEDDVRLTILRFELAILRQIGQLPTLDYCAGCGNPIGTETSFYFRASQGGLICRECRTDRENDQRIHAGTVSAGTVSIVKCIASDSQQAWKRLAVTPAQFREMRQLINAAIAQALGRRPKTLSFLKLS